MTNEELDRARADEAHRLWQKGGLMGNPVIIAARLAREGWTPPDPLLKEAREVCAQVEEGRGSHSTAESFRTGAFDMSGVMEYALAALKRGIEVGKGRGK